jgi:hypothetical protein
VLEVNDLKGLWFSFFSMAAKVEKELQKCVMRNLSERMFFG